MVGDDGCVIWCKWWATLGKNPAVAVVIRHQAPGQRTNHQSLWQVLFRLDQITNSNGFFFGSSPTCRANRCGIEYFVVPWWWDSSVNTTGIKWFSKTTSVEWCMSWYPNIQERYGRNFGRFLDVGISYHASCDTTIRYLFWLLKSPTISGWSKRHLIN
jgi:hypothetical protein